MPTPQVIGIDQFSHGLTWLGSHPSHSLATCKDATVEDAVPMRHKCSSKLCLLFVPFGPTSIQQKAAAKESQLWDSHQLAGLTMILSRDQGVPGLCWGSFALMIVDLTFHEQWHICQVRRWPSYSGSFAWLGSHPSLWLLDSQTNLLNWFALQFLSCSQLRGTNQCCCEGWKQNSFVQC